MEITDSIFEISVLGYIISLIAMYLYLLKDDKRTSVFPANICSNYASKTREKKGKTGVLFYMNHLFGIVAISSLLLPIIIHFLSKG